MKKLFFISTLFICLSALAQDKKPVAVTGTLEKATVYYGYGAELLHKAKTSLASGVQEIVITNLATQADANTIQVGLPENVVLMSHKYATRTLPFVQPEPVKKMGDSIKALQKQIDAINNDYAIQEDVLNRTTKIIENNIGNTPKKEISSVDLVKLLDYYTSKVQTIKTTLYMMQLKRTDLQEKINEIQLRVNEQNTLAGKNSKVVGEVTLQLMTKTITGADITLSYFTRHAGWLPAYDVRMKTLDNSFRLTYKASVTQSTGIDWKDVKLNLSTSNPNTGSRLPLLSPMYLSLYAPVLYDQAVRASSAKMAKKGNSADSETIESIGYGYGITEEKSPEPSTVNAFTNLSESQLNTSFEIDLPYDIPADGKAYSVAIKEEQVKANYQHYTVPKLDKDAFLVAEITDWQNLDLLPGEANIIMDNVYLGKSAINPATTTDTLLLSLGRDRRVSVHRGIVKELSKTSFRGDNKTETYTYEITVRNNKKQDIQLHVSDQVPVSRVKEVEVTLDEKGDAKVDAEKGSLEWMLTLKPGESKKLRFKYSIKYPKDKILHNQK